MTDEFVIGPGFAQRVEALGLTARGPAVCIAPGYRFVLSDRGPLWYRQYTSAIVGPFKAAPEQMPAR